MDDLSKQKKSDVKPEDPLLTAQLGLLATAVQSLPVIEEAKEVKDFRGGGELQEGIFQAQAKLKEEAGKTVRQTIAMFNYMDKYADNLGKPIDTAMQAIPLEKRVSYLEEVNKLMEAKLNRPLWGGEDRESIALQVLSAPAWFRQGKADLLAKSGPALKQGKLESFLSIYTVNLDPKSYGRRVYSLSEGKDLDLGKLRASGKTIEKPPTRTPIP